MRAFRILVGAVVAIAMPFRASAAELQATTGCAPALGVEQFTLQASVDGSVAYEGYGYVAIRGKHRATVAPSPVAKAISALLGADRAAIAKWSMIRGADTGACYVRITRGTTTLLSFSLDESVVSHASGGIPLLVVNLWSAADLDRWRLSNERTVASLIAERWHFKSSDDGTATMVEGVARFGTVEVLRGLIALGAPVRDVEPPPAGHPRYDASALEIAARRGQHEMVALLIKTRKWRAETLSSTLIGIAEYGDVVIARALLASGADPRVRNHQGSWVAAAAYSVDPELVALALKRGSDPRDGGEYGSTALHNAVFALSGHFERGSARRRGQARVIRLLLRHGADPNARTRFNETPLMKCPTIEAARALLAGGANPRAKDNDLRTVAEHVKDQCRDMGPMPADLVRLLTRRR